MAVPPGRAAPVLGTPFTRSGSPEWFIRLGTTPLRTMRSLDGPARHSYFGRSYKAHNLTFNTSGYTVTGNTLTLAGASPTINVAGGTATIYSVVAGSAGVNTTGAGTLILTGANTYSGGTTITSGRCRWAMAARRGRWGPGAVTNNGALIFNRNNALTVASAISGTGTLTQAGTNVLSLTGTNNYSGATTIASGTLSVGAGGATGTLGTGSQVINNGTLQLNRTGTLTLGQDISGTGNLTKLATGVVTLTGTNTYAGTTTISGGTLEVGNGGTTGTLGAGNVTVTGATHVFADQPERCGDAGTGDQRDRRADAGGHGHDGRSRGPIPIAARRR